MNEDRQEALRNIQETTQAIENGDERIPASVERMLQKDGMIPTAPLDDFRRAYAADDNWWWRIECGHHQNLFEAACERIEEMEVAMTRMKMAVENAWKMLNSR